MCGIVDANVAFEIFGDKNKQTAAGRKFLEWVNDGTQRLVVGGQLLQELGRTGYGDWARQAINSGQVLLMREADVAARSDDLRRGGSCKSNDPHVIALAQVSGARLLYTDDGDLKQDFGNRKLIHRPRGKVYPARGDGRFRDGSIEKVHRDLLTRRNLCRPPKHAQ